MPERTPIFRDDVVARLRATLASALGSAEYWEGLPKVRLQVLLATVMNPDFAVSVFADEVAAARAWAQAHSLPSTIDPQTLHQLAKLFVQLVENEQTAVRQTRGIRSFLKEADDQILPEMLGSAEKPPLVIVLRGLSGVGKSSLAEVMARVGFKDHPRVGLLACDIYHCKVGRDKESKRSIYRTEDGGAVAVEPIFAADPVAEVKSLLWQEQFRLDFEQLAGNCPIVVVDGAYGELMLDSIEFPASQRWVIEVCLPAALRFDRLAARAKPFLSSAAARAKITNDVIMSIAWFSLLMENAVDPHWVVMPDPADKVSELLQHRAQQLGHEVGPANHAQLLVQQLNIAREPGTAAVTLPEVEGFLREIFGSEQPLTVAEIAEKNAVELHQTLSDELQRRITVPQFQRLVEYFCQQQLRL